jgi:hypothetical protein
VFLFQVHSAEFYRLKKVQFINKETQHAFAMLKPNGLLLSHTVNSSGGRLFSGQFNHQVADGQGGGNKTSDCTLYN